jgi:hypothetical protein
MARLSSRLRPISEKFLYLRNLRVLNLADNSCRFVFIGGWFPDRVLHVEMRRMISVRPRHQSNPSRANFLHRLLRPEILFTDKEHNRFNKLKGVIQQ